MMIQKLLFIVNRYSGHGFLSSLEGRILDVCASHDAECSISFTEWPGHAVVLAREGAAGGYDAVVAVGGDGTMNEVAQGLLNSTVPMGIVPKGSGNGLARHLGIPLGIRQATKSLFNSEPLKMDTFTVNGKLSLNVSGIGFDGHVANRFGKDGQRGWSAYTRLVLAEYMSYLPFEVTITTGSKEEVRKKDAFIIAIANASQYGNNICIAPKASVCDGLLHLSMFRKMPPHRLDLIQAFFNRSLRPSRYYETLESDAFTIQLPGPVDYHVDGEPGGQADRFDVRIQPASLNMLVPLSMKRKV